jgi:predicted dehydrogenase
MAHYAISHDLPVLVEKPLTMDVHEARTLRRLAMDRKVPLLVDHVYLYHPAYRALRRELGGKAPLTISGAAGNDGPFRPDAPVLWDYGPHDIAMCLDLVGATPSRVRAKRLDRRLVGGAIGETIQLHLEFPSGTKADLVISNLLNERSRLLSVDTGSERLVFDDSGEPKVYREAVGASRPSEPIPFVAEPPLAVAVREFLDAIVRGSPTEAEANLATEVVVTLARCAADLRRAHRRLGPRDREEIS